MSSIITIIVFILILVSVPLLFITFFLFSLNKIAKKDHLFYYSGYDKLDQDDSGEVCHHCSDISSCCKK